MIYHVKTFKRLYSFLKEKSNLLKHFILIKAKTFNRNNLFLACKDKHPKCLEFSINGYCQNPTTMEVLKNQCPESCGHCENDGKGKCP